MSLGSLLDSQEASGGGSLIWPRWRGLRWALVCDSGPHSLDVLLGPPATSWPNRDAQPLGALQGFQGVVPSCQALDTYELLCLNWEMPGEVAWAKVLGLWLAPAPFLLCHLQ